MLGSNNANIKAVITAEDRASSTIENFGKKTSKIGGIIKKGLLAGSVAATAFGVTSVKAFIESEDAAAQLNAVLKSTGGVAGVTAKQAISLANSLQKVTKFSDEEILSAENLLLTFTKINKDIFPATVKIVADMSTALGQDLKSSSIQVGKALQDPILGVTALRRVGVNFSTAQKEVIKKLVETGQSAKAQALILKELQVEFGGSAVAAGQTFGGQLQILKNRFNDVQERIGQFVAEAIPKLIAAFKAAWTFLVTTFGPAIRAVWSTIANNLIPAVRRLKDSLEPALSKVLRVVAAILGGTLLVGLKIAISGIRLFLNALSKVIDIISKVIKWLGKVAGAVVNAFKGVYGAVVSPFRSAFNAVVSIYNATVGRLFGRIGADAQKAQDKINSHTERFGKRQMGGPVTSRKPYLVGERGPELFVPQSSGRIEPNNQLGMRGGGSVINLNVNVGIYAGSEVEKRKMAKQIMEAFQDYAASKNMTASQLLS